MPAPSELPGITRRTGLALALAAPIGLLAACSDGASDAAVPAGSDGSGDVPSGKQAVDQAVQEADLVALYDAVLAAFPGSDAADVLAAVRDQHARHRDALGGATGPSAATPTVPTTLRGALTALADTEREASRARIRACVDAADPEKARLLSLIAASEASHVPALRAARDEATA